MAKEKWGTKRTCPKCGTKFYDLGKENPVICIECGNEWIPEPVLKSRQPQLEAEKPEEKPKDADTKDVLTDEEDLKIEDNTDEGAENVNLEGNGPDVSDVIQQPSKKGDSD